MNLHKVLEKGSFSVALFLSLIPLCGILLGWVNFMKGWAVLLFALLLSVLINWYTKYNKSDLKSHKTYIWIIFLVTCVISAVYLYGSLNQPWREDDDPYGYGVIADYFSETDTFKKPIDIRIENYAEPDTIGFSILSMSIFEVINDMQLTLKFTTILVIFFAFFCFYHLAFELFKDENIAFYSAFAFLMLPVLTRFIFSTPYAVMIMIVALICLLRLQYDKKYFIPVVILTANGLLVNYLVGFVFGLFFIVFFV